jgi:hypothetical protein
VYFASVELLVGLVVSEWVWDVLVELLQLLLLRADMTANRERQ